MVRKLPKNNKKKYDKLNYKNQIKKLIIKNNKILT